MTARGLIVAIAVPGPRLVVQSSGTWERSDGPTGDDRITARFGPAGGDVEALNRWLKADCPMDAAPRIGFVAVTVDASARIVCAAVGPRPNQALFFSADEDRIVIGEHPADVIGEMPQPPDLDLGQLASVALGRAPRGSTPFHGVRALLRGQVLCWRPGQDTLVRQWFSPGDLETIALPSPAAEADALRQAVSAAVARSVPDGTDVGISLSGGLDSSMVAGCAAPLLAAHGHRLRAYVHVPLIPDRGLLGRSLPGDEVWSRRLAGWLPATDWEPVENQAHHLPLDLLWDWFERAWLPILGFNSVWIDEISARARAAEIPVVFHGGSGNDTFSMPPYPPRSADIADVGLPDRLLRKAEFYRQAIQAKARRRSGGGPRFPGYDGAVVRSMLREDALHEMDTRSISHASQISDPRQAWLFRLQRHPLTSTALTLLADDVYRDDVLSDPEVIRVALSLSPQAWMRSGLSRSAARRAAKRVLPFAVRMRVVRGQQSADVGLLMRGRRSSWVDATDVIQGSPRASALVDVRRLRQYLDTWDDDDPEALMSLGHCCLPVVTVGLFAAWWGRQVGT